MFPLACYSKVNLFHSLSHFPSLHLQINYIGKCGSRLTLEPIALSGLWVWHDSQIIFQWVICIAKSGNFIYKFSFTNSLDISVCLAVLAGTVLPLGAAFLVLSKCPHCVLPLGVGRVPGATEIAMIDVKLCVFCN